MPIAIGAFAAIDVVIVAFVLMVWVLATAWMLRPVILFIANLLSNIPAVGDALASALRDLEGGISQWIQSTITNAYRAGATPIFTLMNTYAHAKSGELYSQSIVNGAMYNGVAYAIAHATGVVNSPTQSYVTNSSTVNNTYVLANTDAAVAQSENYTQSSYGVLADWANTAVQSVYNDVVDADGRVATLARQEAADILTANTYAESVSSAAEENAVLRANDYTVTSFKTGEDYTTQVRDYTTSINADTRTWTEGQIETNVRALEELLTAGIGAVVTSVGILEADYTTFRKTCGDPLCDGLLDFAKGMLGIKSLIGTGVLLAFLAEAAANPEGTAAATVTVAEALSSGAKAVAGAAFGV